MIYYNYLASFLATYRYGKLVEASEKIHVSVASISKHIKALEKRLGKELFIIKNKVLVPTEFAHELAIQVSSHLDSLNVVFYPNDLTPQTIRIAGADTILNRLVSHELIDIKSQNNINIDLKYLSNQTIEKRFLDEQLEFALAVINRHISGVKREYLFDIHYVFVANPAVASQFKKEQQENSLLFALRAHCWLFYHSVDWLEIVLSFFTNEVEADVEHKNILYCPSYMMIIDLLVKGHGIGLLPKYAIDDKLAIGELMQILPAKYSFSRPLSLLWRDGILSNKKVLALKKYITQTFKPL